MFKKGYSMDVIQLFALGAMLGNALFVGMGNIITVLIARQDAWLIGLIATIVGLLPIFIICKIMNYEPSLNLIEKIKKIFTKKIAFFINLIIFLFIFALFVINIWSISIFAHTKYLNETPLMFIAFLFLLPIFYSSTKGIETISRTTLLLLYMGIICHVVITASLLEFSNIQNVKPTLVRGYLPIVEGVLKYLTYGIVPFITLLIVPKNDIKNGKKTTLAIVLGYIFSSIIMAIVFFMSMSTVGVEIASMYRYPEYFILKKVSLGRAFDNVENLFSVVWIYNIIVCAMMSLSYLKEYFSSFMKNKTAKKQNIISFIICIFTMYISTHIFYSDTQTSYFMRNYYPFVIGLSSFVIMLIILMASYMKKRKKNM